jgi:hypothetical protein
VSRPPRPVGSWRDDGSVEVDQPEAVRRLVDDNLHAVPPAAFVALADEQREAVDRVVVDLVEGAVGVSVTEVARPTAQEPRGTYQSDLTRDDILDNITLYWLTNTGVSAARLYWENKADFFDAKKITIPFAISVFPDELYQAPRSWAERAYPHNLIHYNQLDRGGRFAAWEQPSPMITEAFADAIRELG